MPARANLRGAELRTADQSTVRSRLATIVITGTSTAMANTPVMVSNQSAPGPKVKLNMPTHENAPARVQKPIIDSRSLNSGLSVNLGIR